MFAQFNFTSFLIGFIVGMMLYTISNYVVASIKLRQAQSELKKIDDKINKLREVYNAKEKEIVKQIKFTQNIKN